MCFRAVLHRRLERSDLHQLRGRDLLQPCRRLRLQSVPRGELLGDCGLDDLCGHLRRGHFLRHECDGLHKLSLGEFLGLDRRLRMLKLRGGLVPAKRWAIGLLQLTGGGGALLLCCTRRLQHHL